MNAPWTIGLDCRILFFTGKGGVGKTSLACALAVHRASNGERVLIVSTDPASNLDEVFGEKLSTDATVIAAVPGLSAINLDPEAAAREYRERMVAPYRGKLSDSILRNIEEQFSGSCTTEIAAFDQFVKLLSDAQFTAQYDCVIFDTAPTGHTLRLLSLPGAWSSYLDTTTAESTCLGPLAGLQDQQVKYEQALSTLRDSTQCAVVLVARPDRSSLKEAARAYTELSELGITRAQLIINAVFRTRSSDAVSRSYTAQTEDALSQLPEVLTALPHAEVPLLAVNTVGIAALRKLVNLEIEDESTRQIELEQVSPPLGVKFEELISDIRQAGHGVVLTMGKGGVGKTTIAAKIAAALAQAGEQVVLTTTDPAGNIADVAQRYPNCKIERIDPATEVEKYTAEVLKQGAERMDPAALELLKEDLRSPCTEEIAVFRAFADAVARGGDRYVVIDTAPTGHTILLMDATESYHREVLRTESSAPEAVRKLLPRLRDAAFTKVILVTLPEPTPVHEAERLQLDLRRAEIEPYAWVVNRAFLTSGTNDPLLLSRASRERRAIEEVASLTERMVVLPWRLEP